jgi:glutamine synthetase
MQDSAINDTESVEAAEQSLREKGVQLIRFEIPDLMGLSRSKTVPIDSFKQFARKGVNMYAGALGLDTASFVVPNSGIGEETGYQDSMLLPELGTIRILPWEPETASVICTPCDATTGEAMPHSSRSVLLSLLERARSLGFGVKTGIELEFYLLDAQTKEPLFGGQHIFLTQRNHWNDFPKDLLTNLHGLGLKLTTHNAEYGSSQFEVNFDPADGIDAADESFRFKCAVKEFAHRSGYIASFMSKPFIDKAGSGCHVHMGLRNRADDSNAFVDPDGPHQLSSTALSFTAGVLRHAGSMTALIAPTVNCYHRFKKGSFAPTTASWGIQDRTALIRMKATGDDATHLEMRGASGLSNPYLSAAATLAAGLIGIEDGYELPALSDQLAEDNEQFELLPQTLETALERLFADERLCEMLGVPFTTLFGKVKEFELERWRAHISDWEMDEFLELY